MSDDKDSYSEASSDFVNGASAGDTEKERLFNEGKERERKHNKRWLKQSVNLNEVVDTFAPGAKGEVHGVKFLFKGERYTVVADMANGSVRVYDTEQRGFVTSDGRLSKKGGPTHFKIKRREEM